MFAGLLWNYLQYTPRFPFGVDGDTKVISLVAQEDIPVGRLVQMFGGLRIARDMSAVAGVAVYDPQRYDSSLVYTAGDVVPVCRKGRVYVSYQGQRSPLVLEDARVYVGAGNGVFTADTGPGTARLARANFSIDTQPQYNNNDGSPAADIPFDPTPILPGLTNTTFGDGVALVEINL